MKTKTQHARAKLYSGPVENGDGIFEGDVCIAVIKDARYWNTARIVRAVNSHEALLNVARWLINEREAGTDKGLLPDGLLNATRKAIEQAEGVTNHENAGM